jgi:hypothetical protein
MTLLTGHAQVYSAYKTLSEAHKWPVLPPDLTPRRAAAIMKGGKALAAGWLFVADGAWSVLEFLFASPDASPEERAQALDAVIENLLAQAKQAGCRVVFTSTSAPTLIERYQKHGFGGAEPNHTNLTYLVK